MADRTDHDLLVKLEEKLDNVVSLISGQNDRCAIQRGEYQKTHKTIFDLLEKKVDAVTFRWVIGIVIALTLFGFKVVVK